MASRRAFRSAARAALGAGISHAGVAIGMRKPAWTRAPYWRVTFDGRPLVEHRLPGGNLRETTLTLVGSGAYSAAGYTPSGSSYWLDDTQTLDKICAHNSLDTLVILCALTVQTAPTGNQGILQWGARSRVSPGGIYLSLASGSQAKMGAFPATTATTGSIATLAIPIGTQIVLCGVVSYETDEIYLAKLGDFGAAAVGNNARSLSAMRAAGTAPNSTAGNYAASILAGHGSSGTVAQEILNAGSGNTAVLDLLLARIPPKSMHRVSTLYRQYGADPTARRYAALESI